MKILSVAIPSYNSQDYMRKCIESLLPGGDDIEIIIVNDGSKDRTGEIAEEYVSRYPGIVKAVHQENGGHGEAVNTGLKNATGLYFKVVDSVEKDAYRKIYSDAFYDLSYQPFERMRTGAAKAYILRRQPVCIPATAVSQEDVLY